MILGSHNLSHQNKYTNGDQKSTPIEEILTYQQVQMTISQL